MANFVQLGDGKVFSGLALTAHEIREQTGWSDGMVEDYDAINRNIFTAIQFINDALNYATIKGLSVTIEGQDTSDPIPTNIYNVSTVARSGVGTYEITLEQGTFFGESVFNKSQQSLAHNIAPSVTSDAYQVSMVSNSATTATITVSAMTQGAGATIALTPYDLQIGDIVYISLLMNLGDDTLPPA